MAKSLGGGFPMGAFWVRTQHADLLGAGSHGTTFGGTPLGCAVALKICEIIERDSLAENARALGDYLKSELNRLAQEMPHLIRSVRGLGLMLGFELAEKESIPAFSKSDKAASIQFVNRLHNAGLLVIPSGTQVIRSWFPALNPTCRQADEGLEIHSRDTAGDRVSRVLQGVLVFVVIEQVAGMGAFGGLVDLGPGELSGLAGHSRRGRDPSPISALESVPDSSGRAFPDSGGGRSLHLCESAAGRLGARRLPFLPESLRPTRASGPRIHPGHPHPEILVRRLSLRGTALFILTVSVCLAFSACYEFIEWWTALATGEGASAFL